MVTARKGLSKEQLERATKSSMVLVRFVAQQLRAKELEFAAKEKAAGLWHEPNSST